MDSPGAFWTAMAALVISMTSAALTFAEAMQGPQIRALPIEDVFIFAAPSDDPETRWLAAVARPEIANTAAHYPDILLSQALIVGVGEDERGCMSARGSVEFHAHAPDAPAPVIDSDAAEFIELTGNTLEVGDVSSRASLPAGDLYSVRQLFDQVAMKSDVNPCRAFHAAVADAPLTAAAFVEAFQGKTVVVRYEARFENDPGYIVDCSFTLTERRGALLLSRGWINMPCTGSPPAQMPSERGIWQNIVAAFDRLF
ncbi:MAG: hypothetical protein ABL871_09855 [Terricaulis sp.]